MVITTMSLKIEKKNKRFITIVTKVSFGVTFLKMKSKLRLNCKRSLTTFVGMGTWKWWNMCMDFCDMCSKEMFLPERFGTRREVSALLLNLSVHRENLVGIRFYMEGFMSFEMLTSSSRMSTIWKRTFKHLFRVGLFMSCEMTTFHIRLSTFFALKWTLLSTHIVMSIYLSSMCIFMFRKLTCSEVGFPAIFVQAFVSGGIVFASLQKRCYRSCPLILVDGGFYLHLRVF